MEKKSSFALQSLLAVLILNALLLVTIYVIGGEALAGKAPLVFGLGGILTLVLWFVVTRLARRLEGASPKEGAARAPAERPAPALPEQPAEAAALQLLAILQRKGRLLDFLQEDLSAYGDAQIGAAVRAVHEGCKKALEEHVSLVPVLDRPEGSPVTVEPGFDARAIRLTGNITGAPPFKGTLRHRGWRVERIELPTLMHAQDRVVAPAEVEVGT
ncbi:DUF2760 domain-containing protein [Rhodocaloribacter litoris]|uniref:DUF2760 domain-containing protein n=1 Tax=Rhodocaloribacter litoris TaxID=2558931 RepID=UPI001420D7A1|nr:DUF2760 domain-containing protein [Rhodocaloribacter litoris]QXD14063.1 DUF2760 domain-containing protein [Rhodocaloribacter litoris]